MSERAPSNPGSSNSRKTTAPTTKRNAELIPAPTIPTTITCIGQDSPSLPLESPTNDYGLLNWGVEAFKHGIHDIQDDGTLPMELGRGQMALHYHLYALAPLMMLAEFGETNGLDLYAERDYAIKRLVARCIAGLQDPSFFQKKTGDEQVTTPGIEAWQISWAQYYTRRFPDPKISQLMSQAERLNYTMLGGLPPP